MNLYIQWGFLIYFFKWKHIYTLLTVDCNTGIQMYAVSDTALINTAIPVLHKLESNY